MLINIKQFVRFFGRADFKERASVSLTFPNAKTAPHVTFAPSLPSRLEPKAAATPVLRPSNLRLHHIALHRLHPFIALIHPTNIPSSCLLPGPKKHSHRLDLQGTKKYKVVAFFSPLSKNPGKLALPPPPPPASAPILSKGWQSGHDGAVGAAH